MSIQSIIEHRANYYYVELREDFLQIALACTYKKPVKEGQKSKASAHCKALILAIMEGWTNHKRGANRDLSVSMSYAQWSTAMYGMFGRNAILDSLEELIGEGLLSREVTRIYGKDTYKYLLNFGEVNRRLKALPDHDLHSSLPNAFTSKPDTNPQVNGSEDYPSTSKPVAFTNKPDTCPKVNPTGLQVNADPSQSKPFIESHIPSSYHQNTESNDDHPPAHKNKNDSQFVFTPPEEMLLEWIADQQYEISVTPATYSRIKKQLGELIRDINTPEKLTRLCTYIVPKIKGEDKTVYLGNMVRWVATWAKSEQSSPPKDDAETLYDNLAYTLGDPACVDHPSGLYAWTNREFLQVVYALLYPEEGEVSHEMRASALAMMQGYLQIARTVRA